MFSKIKKDKKTYGIIGLGRFGYALATELAESGADLLVMDRDETKVRELRELTENAFVVQNLDKASLAESGIRNCDVAVVCIGEQISTSILTTLHLVSLGIPTVIAKANSMEHGEILEKLGAHVVYPERDMALRLAHQLEASQVLDFIQLSEKINITKVDTPKIMENCSVKQLDLRKRFGLNIVAIENSLTVLQDIHPDYILREHDILYLAGSKESVISFSDWIARDGGTKG